MNPKFIETDDEHFKLCYSLRKKAINALTQTVKDLTLGETNEIEAQKIFETQLRKEDIDEYWYPAGEEGPHKKSQFGLVCHFSDIETHKNLTHSTARTLEVSDTKWNGLGYFYASPHKTYLTDSELKGAWGDVGLVIYLGDNKNTQDIIKKEYQMIQRILAYIKANISTITTSKVYSKYIDETKKMNLTNYVKTITGQNTGQSSTNIGHNFPNLGIPMSKNPNHKELIELMSRSRKFVDEYQPIKLNNGIWTLESRDIFPGFEHIGSISFHMVYSLKNKTFTLFPNYDYLFMEVGMEWINEDSI